MHHLRIGSRHYKRNLFALFFFRSHSTFLFSIYSMLNICLQLKLSRPDEPGHFIHFEDFSRKISCHFLHPWKEMFLEQITDLVVPFFSCVLFNDFSSRFESKSSCIILCTWEACWLVRSTFISFYFVGLFHIPLNVCVFSSRPLFYLHYFPDKY